MKRDIDKREVTDLGIALVPAEETKEGKLWDVFIVNLKTSPIKNVLVNVTGRSGGDVPKGHHTATLRYYFPEIAAESWSHIEAVLPEVMKLDNQYWVSFQHENYLFDKKYTVPQNPEETEDMWLIPLMGKIGLWFE